MKLTELTKLKIDLEQSYFSIGDGISDSKYQMLESKMISNAGFTELKPIESAQTNIRNYLHFLKPDSALLKIVENETVVFLATRTNDGAFIVNLEQENTRQTGLKEIRNIVNSMNSNQRIEVYEML